jgi:hypothetical protein
MVRGMKIMPLYYPPLLKLGWHNSHPLPLHNRGTLPPVHELFKQLSYIFKFSVLSLFIKVVPMLKNQAMKTYRHIYIKFHVLLTCALDGGE